MPTESVAVMDASGRSRASAILTAPLPVPSSSTPVHWRERAKTECDLHQLLGLRARDKRELVYGESSSDQNYRCPVR